MEIHKLPENYKRLIEKRTSEIETYFRDRNPKSNNLSERFMWFQSPEGFEFWNKVYEANGFSDLPSIPVKDGAAG